MKYPGRSLVVFLTIMTLLYGTKEVWDLRTYNAYTSRTHNEPDPSSYKRGETIVIGGLGGQTFGQGGAGYR